MVGVLCVPAEEKTEATVGSDWWVSDWCADRLCVSQIKNNAEVDWCADRLCVSLDGCVCQLVCARCDAFAFLLTPFD